MNFTKLIIFLSFLIPSFSQITFDMYGNINNLNYDYTHNLRMINSLGIIYTPAPAPAPAIAPPPPTLNFNNYLNSQINYCQMCNTLMSAMSLGGVQQSGIKSLKRYCKYC